jgi:hypothetical protein
MTCQMAMQLEQDLGGGDQAEVTALMLAGLSPEDARAVARGRRKRRTRMLHGIGLFTCPHLEDGACEFRRGDRVTRYYQVRQWAEWMCSRLDALEAPEGCAPLPLFGVRAWGPKGGASRW